MKNKRERQIAKIRKAYPFLTKGFDVCEANALFDRSPSPSSKTSSPPMLLK